MHDALLVPIVPPKYNIGIVLSNANAKLIDVLEPWCDCLCVDCDFTSYLENEQPNTDYNLADRIHQDKECDSDIKVFIDGSTFSENDYQVINQLSQIIQNSGEPNNKYVLGNINVEIKDKKEYTKDLINL